MSTVISVVPRVRPLKAMRVLLGITTKDDILAFCPRADVGVKATFFDGELVDDDKDIRWVHVPHNGELWDRLQTDGDWIVQVADGHWIITPDADFHREYVIA